jgi:hypothetical protein
MIHNLSSQGTLINLRPQDAVLLQSVRRTLTHVEWNNNSRHYQPQVSMASKAGLPLQLFRVF